ncbi:hypothetical protein QBZ16_004333 [Prototheca wickerhamii]|uniref:Uncharacterized protein n=1 Tax=Prototheca wickerhamii TaxID=3111 RepID=A0AAD9IH52_PROWI|nr:hypothetical protein QBZ16_004333 [Prototheca wickerhamii]
MVLSLDPAPPAGADARYLVSAGDVVLRLEALPPGERLGDALGKPASQRFQAAGFRAWVEPGAAAGGGRLPALWLETAEQVRAMLEDQGATVAVLGAKKVGKSTFARLLVNTLLRSHREVALLETDCGQVEFGVPGLLTLSTVSAPLTGPPFLRQLAGPGAAAGAPRVVAPRPRGSARYVRCVAALAAARAAQLPRATPLVVNTHGWTRGVGQDVLAALLSDLRPGLVVQVSCGEPRKDLPDGDWWSEYTPSSVALGEEPAREAEPEGEGGRSARARRKAQAADAAHGPHYWLLPPVYGDAAAASAARGMSPVELRAAQWTHWARRCARAMGVPEGPAPADLLASAAPYAARWEDVAVEALFARRLTPDQTAVAVNGSVVGLCRARDGACLGVGLVRAVDGQNHRLYLLTDLAPEELEGVDVLQLGRLELPGTLLQSPSFRSPYMALHCLPTLGTGSGQSKSRNNIPRASQLKQ